MIVDGKRVAETIQQELQQQIPLRSDRHPTLAVLLVGEHSPSKIYIRKKTAACEALGIRSITKKFPSTISEEAVLTEIFDLNNDPTIDGILVQLPLPSHIHQNKVTEAINPDKDVDGFHPINVGKMLIGQTDGFFPCTPLGVKALLERSHIEVDGKQVVILGRSVIVGKPMAALLMQNAPGANATVTIAHSHTKNLPSLCREADILIAAMGKPQFVTSDMIKEGAVVIDVGINRIPHAESKNGYKIVGDVDFVEVEKKCFAITPVPGGIGPMTIAMLLANTVKAFLKGV